MSHRGGPSEQGQSVGAEGGASAHATGAGSRMVSYVVVTFEC